MYSINILLPIFIVLTFIKCVDLIYLFQIKEYRFDRFVSFIKEEGIFNILYFRGFRTPAKSIRNILLVGVSLVLILLFPLYLFSGFVGLILLLIQIPPLALIFVSIGVYLTGFLANIQRNSTIEKATEKVKNSSAVFIGVTGSYGKSSVKEFLYAILSAYYKTAKTDENKNTDVGVALSILKNLKPDTRYFIAEMGAYRLSEIKKICNFVHPKIAVLTAIGNQHLDLFGSKENLETAKAELLEAVPPSGKVYINASVAHKDFFESKTKAPLIYYSLSSNTPLYAEKIEQKKEGMSALITYKEQSFTIQTQLVGTHTIENLLPAIGAGIDLGVPIAVIQKTASQLTNIEAKLSLHSGVHGTTILNDVKNSSVEGFIAALKTASHFPNKTKYIVSKGIIELGSEKGESYRRIVSVLNDVNIVLFTTDSMFSQQKSSELIKTYKDEKTLLEAVSKKADAEALIILEGKFTKNFVNYFLKNTP